MESPRTGRPLTVDVCEPMAERLEEVITKLRSWDLRVLDFNRLATARRRLLAVAKAGSYPSDPVVLREIAHALIDGHEFTEIVDSLPPDKMEFIVHELQHAVSGSLAQTTGSRKPFQFQSQFWVGAMLAATGRSPLVPVPSDRIRLDFLIENGTYLYGIEVKRPTTAATAPTVVESAARQLSDAGFDGAIAIDVTDCLGLEFIGQGAVRQLRAKQSEFLAQVNALSAVLYDDEERRLRPLARNVVALVVFAKGIYWDLDEPQVPTLVLHAQFASYYRNQPKTLRYHRGIWLRDLFHEGILRGGYIVSSTADPGFD